MAGTGAEAGAEDDSRIRLGAGGHTMSFGLGRLGVTGAEGIL